MRFLQGSLLIMFRFQKTKNPSPFNYRRRSLRSGTCFNNPAQDKLIITFLQTSHGWIFVRKITSSARSCSNVLAHTIYATLVMTQMNCCSQEKEHKTIIRPFHLGIWNNEWLSVNSTPQKAAKSQFPLLNTTSQLV